MVICLQLDIALLIQNAKSDTVCRSYDNVYRGLLFSRTQCTYMRHTDRQTDRKTEIDRHAVWK